VDAGHRELQRREKPVGVGDAPARDQRDGSAEAFSEVRERLHQSRRHAHRVGRRRHVEQRAVDVDEQGPIVRVR
jgi:hypothetical protein